MRSSLFALFYRSIGISAAVLTAAAVGATDCLEAAQGGRLKVVVVDAETRGPLACRLHLKNSRGLPVRLRGRDLVVHGDHVVFDGEAVLELRTGSYTFALDAGPEFKPRTGHFQIENHAEDEETIEMHRFVDLAEEEWWGGDSLCVRLFRQADLLMRAEDLRMLPLSVPAGARRSSEAARQGLSPPEMVSGDRIAAVQSVYVEDDRGAVVVHNLTAEEHRTLLASTTDTASAIKYADQHGYHVDVAYAASWDLPLWLAAGRVDSIQLIDSTSLLEDVRPLPTGCRKADRSFFPGKAGQGRWAERIYYHVLNCGLRIPPSAGSGSGLTPSPPGTNRVYVHADPPLDYDTWWANVRSGRVVVTNGPLLRPGILGHPPGQVFHLNDGEGLDLEIALNLATRHPIRYLEVIKNGEVESEVQLDKWAEAGGRLPPVHFDESGWLLIRAATTDVDVYRHATTAPYYVESNDRPRIRRTSVQFFLDWLDELEGLDRREDRLDAERAAHLTAARAYWNDLRKRANAP